MSTKYEVGQKLWFVSSQRRGGAHETIVERVGRVWTYLSNGYRINAQGFADGAGFMSPGRAYLTQADHEAEVAHREAWSDFLHLVRHRINAPNHLTTEQITAMTAAIKGPKT